MASEVISSLDNIKTSATGFDPTNAISQGLNLIVGTVAGVNNAKKQRELQERLAKLTLNQQKELEQRLQDTQSEIQRLDIMYRTFAVLENQKLIDSRKNKQLTLFYFLGAGSLILVGMAIVYKMRK